MLLMGLACLFFVPWIGMARSEKPATLSVIASPPSFPRKRESSLDPRFRGDDVKVRGDDSAMRPVACLLILLIAISSYSLYKLWGDDALVANYYTSSAIMQRQQNKVLRARLVDLSKAEYALRVRLERVPHAPRLSWQLEDLLAQRAMLAGAWKQAYQHWQAALLDLSRDPLLDKLHKESQQRITTIIKILEPMVPPLPLQKSHS